VDRAGEPGRVANPPATGASGCLQGLRRVAQSSGRRQGSRPPDLRELGGTAASKPEYWRHADFPSEASCPLTDVSAASQCPGLSSSTSRRAPKPGDPAKQDPVLPPGTIRNHRRGRGAERKVSPSPGRARLLGGVAVGRGVFRLSTPASTAPPTWRRGHPRLGGRTAPRGPGQRSARWRRSQRPECRSLPHTVSIRTPSSSGLAGRGVGLLRHQKQLGPTPTDHRYLPSWPRTAPPGKSGRLCTFT
jgi:hypothetical protein